ncbi:MAG: hypothetical protein WC789_06890 [Lentisphaeria bacterium]
MANRSDLDAMIARLQSVPPWVIEQIHPGTGKLQPWFTVNPAEVVRCLVIQDDNLPTQVASVSAQIFHWARLAALARRAWEVREREYRIWRDRLTVSLMDPPEKPKEWKRPTEAQVTASVRVHPEYPEFYQRTEVAEEAYNATQGVLEAFRAQLSSLDLAVSRAQSGGAPRMSM